MKDRILRLPELIRTLGISATTIWRKEQSGTFPKRFKIGIRNVGWLQSEIQSWIEKQSGKKLIGDDDAKKA